ncbi:MAG: hypothetical protein JNM89_02040 [Hyphomicrobiaceae bacterium]|nr:hypothetical protein [Hyphomicrobiaceae bacterium]
MSFATQLATAFLVATAFTLLLTAVGPLLPGLMAAFHASPVAAGSVGAVALAVGLVLSTLIACQR